MPGDENKIQQLTEVLQQRFFPYLPELERPGWTPVQKLQNRLSRSLAALAILKHGDTDSNTAASSVIDDFDDNGIDAVYFDRTTIRLLLVQSKFKANGGEPDQAEMKKFLDGVRDLLRKQYERFNDRFHAKLPEIEDALDQAGLRVVVVLAYTGNTLAHHARTEVDDFLSEVNKFAPLASFELFTIDKAHELLADEHSPKPINLTLTLENWYRVTKPFKAFYGQVSAAQLAHHYLAHGKGLFQRNIRYYMGSSDVNDAIAKTVRENPESLFYLNNGLTAICREIIPKPTAHPDCGEFDVKGFSVVNGAQTVGSIAGVASTTDISASPARLLVTVIEVGQAPNDYDVTITYCRNYQNQVRAIDFAALDPIQERLHRELAISSINYYYKPTIEAQTVNDNSFTIEEAAVALASFSGKTDFAVTTKKEIGKVLDRNGKIYPELFRDTTGALWVCRAVRAYRFLIGILYSNELASGGTTMYASRMFYRHFRYFVLHVLARKSRVLRRPEINLSEDDLQVLSRELNELATIIFDEAEKFKGHKGYLALSRNLTDAVQLAEKVMNALAAKEHGGPIPPNAVPPNPPTN